MKKETKEKILRIIGLKTKDLPRKERYLYTLAYVLFFNIQYLIILYMVFFLSRQWSYLGILAIIYLLVLIFLIFFAEKKGKKLEQRDK